MHPPPLTEDPGRRRWLATVASAVLAAAAAPVRATARPAPPPELRSELPAAQLRGQGRLNWFGLHVYDARLWAEKPVASEPLAHPLALEIEYARTLSGARIAERSISEMRRLGDFSAEQAEAWLAQLKRLLPDVHAGDRITGVQRPGQSTRLYLNGRLRGAVDDAEFTRLFFGVWLSPRSSEPGLRARLLAEPAGAGS